MKKKTAPIFLDLLILVGVFLTLTLMVGIYLVRFDCQTPLGAPSCTQILFIGNSYTSVNDLPDTFTKLARSGGYKALTGRFKGTAGTG